uniref:superoxide dismutase n=1 Tax=Bombyx mori TaxID=7091 RepID=A0A8R2LZF3_BOMMO|nr:titin isoform X3 [Bombyx mori]
MELVVHLERGGHEDWGLEISRPSEDAPIEVIKVVPGSAADMCSLKVGDVVMKMNGIPTAGLPLDSARHAIEEASSLDFFVRRGLYDPVLDDQEPLLESPPPADFDRQSEPTEVQFKIEQFIEPPSLDIDLFDPSDRQTSRSLTSSPFVTPTKPYRPFSTEPLPDIPPIEDPIILNPNYRDEFGKSSESLDNIDILALKLTNAPERKFKLPISEQYDPEGRRAKSVLDDKIERRSVSFVSDETVTKSSKDVSMTFKEESRDVQTKEEKILEEKRFLDEMKEEIDLEKIEKTALLVVDETIEQAVAVTKQIEKEIKEEQHSEMKLKDDVEQKIAHSEKVEKSLKEEIMEQEELVVSKTEEKIVAETSKSEKHERTEFVNEHASTENTIYELKENETAFETESTVYEKEVVKPTPTKHIEEEKQEYHKQKYVDKGHEQSSARIEAEQRVYAIGLQTIPNIKGVVHSHHYDLLLKTFFIHLTDVMVALSRFILTQPALSKTEERQCAYRDSINETYREDLVSKSKVEDNRRRENKMVSQNESKIQEFESKEVKEFDKFEMKESRKSGAKMAQMSDRRNEELTKKMETVITELESRAAEELEVRQRRRRSSSRSSIEEEVARESDPLEWLDKVDSRRASLEKEVTSKQFSSEFKSNAHQNVQSKHEYRKHRTSTNNTDRNTYRAVVEAHVYTNPDVIFEDYAAEMSEMTVETAEKVKIASEVSEAVTSERVAIETAKRDEAKAVVKETHKLATTSAKSHATVGVLEEKLFETKDSTHEVHSKEKATVVQETQKVVVQEMQQVIEPVTEITKELNKTEIGKTVTENDLAIAVAESTEITDVSTHDTLIIEEANTENVTVTISDTCSAVNVNEVEYIKDELSVLKVSDEKFEKSNQILVKTDTALEVNETQVVAEELQELEIKKEESQVIESVNVVEQEAIEIAEVEIARDEYSELSLSKEETEIIDTISVVEQQALSITEVDVAEDELKTLEILEEKADTAKVLIEQEERESISKITEVKVEKAKTEDITITENIVLPKHVTKTSAEEYAELKIKKYQVIDQDDGDGVEVITVEEDISELNLSERKLDRLHVEELEQRSSEISDTHKASLESLTQKNSALSSETTMVNHIEINEQVSSQQIQIIDHSTMNNLQCNSEYTSQKIGADVTQSVEQSFTARSSQNLSLRIDVDGQLQSDENNDIDTPSPSTMPPTPLTDEYIFRLELPLPKSRGTTPVPPDPEPVPIEEDPAIVKKKLVPHVEIMIEDPIIYDPPLPSPPWSKPTSPVYRKPGLRGGADRPQYRKDEIREIERKSSLLASAIDETIKSIEEYKECVGMETRTEVTEVKEHSSSKTSESRTIKGILVNGNNRRSEKSKVDISNDVKETKTEVSKIEDENKNVIVSEVNTLKDQDEEIISNVVEVQENMTATESNNSKRDQNTSEVGVIYSNNNDERIVISKEHATERAVTNSDKLDAVANKEQEIQEKININENLEVSNSIATLAGKDIAEKQAATNEIPVSIAEAAPQAIKQDSANPAGHIEAADATAKQITDDNAKIDYLEFVKPVKFDPEECRSQRTTPAPPDIEELLRPHSEPKVFITDEGEPLGTVQGIVDGLEQAVVDEELAKELGKPGMSEEKIAELISGEAEMLREAHVMGVDFKKIKPMIDSLKDSEVLKVLNEEEERKALEKKKKEEKRWTTFLQKPKRPVPGTRLGHPGHVEETEADVEPYRVKIVKQPKPKVAPDYKPEDFDTGPLPWEQRAVVDASLPPVEPEEPILIPEEAPEFVEAVDPLPETEVPDLEETGIPLPEPVVEDAPSPIVPVEELPPEAEPSEELVLDQEEETEKIAVDMEENRIAEELMRNVQNLVDPNAPLEKQLVQMRAQLAALAQLPCVIQQTLEQVTKQLIQVSHQEEQRCQEEQKMQYEYEEVQESSKDKEPSQVGIEEMLPVIQEEVLTPVEATLTREELEMMKKEEQEMIEEQLRIEKQKKIDVWNDIWPWGDTKVHPSQRRINFMKYEKPPVSLDHLQHSEVYKLIHDEEQTPLRRVELLTPVIAEEDYRELEVLVNFDSSVDDQFLEKTIKTLKTHDGIKEVGFKDGAFVVETVLPSANVLDVVGSVTGRPAVIQGFGETQSAVAMVSDQSCCNKILGVVRLQQTAEGPLVADGSIDGLSPGRHGLHVYESGDLSQGCNSIGGHYNPSGGPHGGPGDPPDRRHAGDLGNITADANGRAAFRIVDDVLKVWDVIGRSMGVTERGDDCGRGDGTSRVDGNSGPILACGIIARSAGIFQNPKRICACDGVVVWDERDKPLAGSGRRGQGDRAPSEGGCCGKAGKTTKGSNNKGDRCGAGDGGGGNGKTCCKV